MKLKHKLKGLKAVGIGNALRAFPYAIWKGRLDKRYLAHNKPGMELPPGRPLRSVPEKWGVAMAFDNANMELRLLSPSVMRLTWTPGLLPVPYVTGDARFPEYAVEAKGDHRKGFELDTGRGRIVVSPDGCVTVLDNTGQVLWVETTPINHGSIWRRKSPLHKEAALFGTGERTAPLNLRPGRYRFFNREPRGSYKAGDDPLYMGIPFFLCFSPVGCVGIFYENTHDGTFTFEDDFEVEFTGGALRSYVFLGTPAEIMDSYTQLTGRPSMPPLWALGYHQSRWSYMTEQEVERLVADFQANGMPLSAVHLDIHYMDGYRIFTVDERRFPDMAGMAARLEKMGVRLVAILDPGVKADPHYHMCVRGYEGRHFLKVPDKGVVRGPVWPGSCCFPDFTRAKTRAWWAEQYKTLTDWGISGVWHDMNEPAVFTPWGQSTLPLGTHHDMDGRGGDHREAHNIYGLLEAKAGYEGLRAAKPGRRPWLLSRSGWAGLQKYSWNWTGDCPATWWMVKQSIIMSLGLACSGIPYTGPDIGGFNGEPDGEMYTRWFQLASFLPFFRTHSAAFVPRREPWSFGRPFTQICKEFLKLRYRMLPYWYTMAYAANRTGRPLVRPMLFDYPELTAYAQVDDQFLLGESIIVAPVVTPLTKSRTVLLPPGGWVNFWTDEYVEGGREVKVQAELDIVPLFVKAGTILPMALEDGLELNVYLPGMLDEAKGELYADSGDGYGAFRVDSFRFSTRGRIAELVWDSEGEYPVDYKTVKVVLRGKLAEQAEADGVAVLTTESNVIVTKPFKKMRLALRLK